MTTELTVFEPANIAMMSELAPRAYNDNQASHDKCMNAGQSLLDRAKAYGMSDELDQEIANFINKSRNTLRVMNERRAPVTKIFDSVRSAYTGLENDVDPARKGTVPYRLQELRNGYAAQKREEKEAELRRRQIEVAKENAKAKYAADVEEDYGRQFNALVNQTCNKIISLDKSVTLGNYDQVFETVKAMSDKLPEDWLSNLRPAAQLPSVISMDDCRAIADGVKQKMEARFREQYTYEVGSTRDDMLDRMPSKRKELEKIAAANEEEAQRIRQQMAERERAEAEQREKERAEREARELAEAAAQAQKREMEGLFAGAEAQVAQYQPKTQVKKRIRILNAEAFMQIVGMWWAQCGSSLSVEELEKIFAKQLTYCNKMANDKNPVLIKSDYIEYIDDIKAK